MSYASELASELYRWPPSALKHRWPMYLGGHPIGVLCRRDVDGCELEDCPCVCHEKKAAA